MTCTIRAVSAFIRVHGHRRIVHSCRLQIPRCVLFSLHCLLYRRLQTLLPTSLIPIRTTNASVVVRTIGLLPSVNCYWAIRLQGLVPHLRETGHSDPFDPFCFFLYHCVRPGHLKLIGIWRCDWEWRQLKPRRVRRRFMPRRRPYIVTYSPHRWLVLLYQILVQRHQPSLDGFRSFIFTRLLCPIRSRSRIWTIL
jgi:hypothetical protein